MAKTKNVLLRQAMKEDFTEKVRSFFQNGEDMHIVSHLVQCLEYLPENRRTVFSLKHLYDSLKDSDYKDRSHAIKFISIIPEEQRTLEMAGTLCKLALYVAKAGFRYDIFDAIEAVPQDERGEILSIVTDVLEEFHPKTELYLSYRVHKLIDTLHQMQRHQRPHFLRCLKERPVILLHADLPHAIQTFYPLGFS